MRLKIRKRYRSRYKMTNPNKKLLRFWKQPSQNNRLLQTQKMKNQLPSPKMIKSKIRSKNIRQTIPFSKV